LLNLMLNPYVIHPVQLLLDYGFAFMLLGTGTLGITSRLNSINLIIDSFIGGFLRFLMHVLSGVIYFSEYAGEQNVWIYSIIYNGSYILPSTILTIFVGIGMLYALKPFWETNT
jgi:thiamine transporter